MCTHRPRSTSLSSPSSPPSGSTSWLTRPRSLLPLRATHLARCVSSLHRLTRCFSFLPRFTPLLVCTCSTAGTRRTRGSARVGTFARPLSGARLCGARAVWCACRYCLAHLRFKAYQVRGAHGLQGSGGGGTKLYPDKHVKLDDKNINLDLSLLVRLVDDKCLCAQPSYIGDRKKGRGDRVKNPFLNPRSSPVAGTRGSCSTVSASCGHPSTRSSSSASSTPSSSSSLTTSSTARRCRLLSFFLLDCEIVGRVFRFHLRGMTATAVVVVLFVAVPSVVAGSRLLFSVPCSSRRRALGDCERSWSLRSCSCSCMVVPLATSARVC